MANFELTFRNIDDLLYKDPIANSEKVYIEQISWVTINFDLFKLYSDNMEFKEDFSAMMFGVVKNLIQKGFNNSSDFR